MAFCVQCGGELLEGAAFCNMCGRPVAKPGTAPSAPVATGAPAAASPVPAAGAGMSPNVAGLLTYVLGLITGVVFLVLEPYNKDKFVRFHAFQSIFLNVVMIAFWIVWTIFSMLMWTIGYRLLGFTLGGLISSGVTILGVVIFLGFLAAWIILMVKAYGNQRFELPVIGKLAARQAG
jgi:uncharacterized membrane protein